MASPWLFHVSSDLCYDEHMVVPTPEPSIDEIMSVCIARQLEDGEIVAQGLATPLVVAGFLLAKLTHAPHLGFASAIGQAICEDWAPLGLARIEDLWLGKALVTMGFARVVTEVLPRHPVKEFFRPGQIDACGNFNNIAFGENYERPLMRLPGTGGGPDVSTFSDQVYIYVPRHSKVTFVEQVDFVSGLGHSPDRKQGAGPRYCITDLGQFDWAHGRLRLVSYHPGVSVEQIRRKTGFELDYAPDLHETVPPTSEEVALLREQIDPFNIRKLETLGGQARKDLIRDVLERENAW
jgi:acyl CoA:acetate/3-ketoacid CoA transferase beta subunit